jgi:NHL repeat/Fibronectin type III domain
VTPAGVVTTLSSFSGVGGTAVDAAGNIYFGDSDRISKLTPAGSVTTLASGFFSSTYGVAVDSAGNVFVAEELGHDIRQVTPAGLVTTLAGSGVASYADGTGAAAGFRYPTGVAVDAAGIVYVADLENNRVRKVTPAGEVTTLAGSGPGFADGTGAAASFNGVIALAVDALGNVYVSDRGQRIRMVTSTGVVTTLAGSGTAGFADGTGAAAAFNFPVGIAVGSDSKVYVADYYNHRIRQLTSVGIGELAATWTASTTGGTSVITGYAAAASAVGYASQTCTTAGATSCTVSGLVSGVLYSVSVTATNAVGTSAPSASVAATPN